MPLSNIDDLFQFEELSACRDAGWPDCFNTGLFVLKPSLGWYLYQLCVCMIGRLVGT